MKIKKLLFVVNVDWFFISHRLPIALAALKDGYEVHVASGITDKHNELVLHGFIVHPLPLVRGRTSLFYEFYAFLSIFTLLRLVKPDVLHLVSIKPVLYGGIAARLVGIKNVVSAISGLGYVFTSTGVQAVIRRFFIVAAYRLALGHRNLKVIFQNSNDKNLILKIYKLTPMQIHIIPGSGVDLKLFHYTMERVGTPLVVMASRLLEDKGVNEFIGAAKLLKEQGIDADFLLAGDQDSENPASISNKKLKNIITSGIVQFLGEVNDINELFSRAHIVVLPSYREGFPKVLIEAAACGRAIITTDVPGCRDAIINNQTGLLVPAKDIISLSIAIKKLISDLDLRNSMGQAGRELAERRYSVSQVIETHLEIYKKNIP